ncbi:MAG: hypothetical protein U1E73_01135 [Planctomycetota bacterium]
MKTITTALAAAAFAAAVPAQMINVSLANGWTAVPASQSVFNTFSGVVFGGCSADVGTSLSLAYTRATATVQGILLSGSGGSGGTVATAGRIEFYSKATPGTATATLNAQPEPGVYNLRGQGYSGQAQASVMARCPLFGWQRATAIATAVPPPAFPFMATVPVTATGTASGITSFNTNMSAGGSANGTLTQIPSGIQLFAGANVTGTVVLN